VAIAFLAAFIVIAGVLLIDVLSPRPRAVSGEQQPAGHDGSGELVDDLAGDGAAGALCHGHDTYTTM
jgi:hypothetical protein